ncbi:MAG: methyltransferase domain-containing protein [Candidatus Thermoplasmatota archaeon]|nr:methyltransferase domain-containing protein [Candidatus Thermoplasmatota archaeon]
MVVEDDRKRIVVEQFGKKAREYVESRGHAQGLDLQRIIEWSHPEKTWKALDIATGGGHVARTLHPYVGLVIATDLTWNMLNAARDANIKAGADDIIYLVADAENLPFLDETFDMVTCRIAPHHFTDKGAFIREVSRVLKSKGIFIMIDNVVPGDAELGMIMNTFEKMRDRSHVECASVEDWKSMIMRNNLYILREEVEKKMYSFKEWVARTTESSEQVTQTEKFIKGMPERALDYFQVRTDNNKIVSLKVDQWMVMARRK